MSVCPPPSRKHTAFRLRTLARGLHGNLGMRNQFLFLSTFIATLTALATPALAQEEQFDAITQIDGEAPTTDAAIIYFNAANCADAANTFYDLTLVNGDGIRQVYMWAAAQNGNCELNDRRTDLQLLCRPMADSAPRTVGDNSTVTGLTLQELVDTEVVDCENTALEGQPFEIYSFRDEDPGGTEIVPPENYGIAEFRVDVTPPEQLNLTSSLDQVGSTFTISWSSPTDSNQILQYKLYRGDSPDPAAAIDTEVVERVDSKDISVSATDLNLEADESTYLFVSAVDSAAMRIGDGNEGELSEATLVTAVETVGFCDDPSVDCSGCSVSPMVLPNGQPGSGIWLIGLVFAVVFGWRLRR
jgi:hypothetical protein